MWNIQALLALAQAEAAKMYAAEVYPDMVGRHRGRSERGRSGVATYNSQVTNHPPAASIVACTAARLSNTLQIAQQRPPQHPNLAVCRQADFECVCTREL